MPYTDRADKNEYARQYYHRRRAGAIARLGGKCARCSVEDDLQFHHRCAEDKSFAVGRLWSVSKERYEAEIDKCELLCEDCHRDEHRTKEHGTRSMYRYCKCDVCRSAHNAYMKAYKALRKQAPSVMAAH